MTEWKKLLVSVRENRWRGQIHLMQRDGHGICGRKVNEHRLTDDINLVTCLNCNRRRMYSETVNDILRTKGRFVKQQRVTV